LVNENVELAVPFWAEAQNENIRLREIIVKPRRLAIFIGQRKRGSV
jgi:hypothetical protein